MKHYRISSGPEWAVCQKAYKAQRDKLAEWTASVSAYLPPGQDFALVINEDGQCVGIRLPEGAKPGAAWSAAGNIYRPYGRTREGRALRSELRGCSLDAAGLYRELTGQTPTARQVLTLRKVDGAFVVSTFLPFNVGRQIVAGQE